jgi:hypothetical protein
MYFCFPLCRLTWPFAQTKPRYPSCGLPNTNTLHYIRAWIALVQHANHSHIISIRWIEVDVGQFPATRLLNLGFFESTPKTPSPTPHVALFPRVDPRPRVVLPLARFRPDSQKRRLGRLVVDNFFKKRNYLIYTFIHHTRITWL